MYNIFNMIIVKKSGYLKYKDLKFRCALGKAGINKKKRKVIISLLKEYIESLRFIIEQIESKILKL